MEQVSTTFLGASVIASFLGGMLAFLAPCCVSFLFPAYFASAFRVKSKIFQMTFIYFLGLALVLVPVGLGVTALSLTISRYHDEVFIIGGVFLIILAIMTIFGKTFPMPFKIKPNLQKSDPLSIFILGMLSGAASSCCTPVLVGVLTITALSGTFLYALILSLTYVLGMVFPLFLLSYFWDKYNFSRWKLLQGKLFQFKLLGKKYFLHSSHLVAAIILAGMGILIITLALAGKTWTSAAYLKKMTSFFGTITTFVLEKSQFIPEYIWITLTIIIIILIIWRAFRPEKEKNRKDKQ